MAVLGNLLLGFLLFLPLYGEDKGLLVLYDFQSSDSGKIIDKSSSGEALNLKVLKPNSIEKVDGALKIKGKTLIRSEKPATKIIQAVKKSGQLTIEAWVTPANSKQKGPARIISISKDTTNRNFTLGQDVNKFDFRFRTTKTDRNGLPSVTSNSKEFATKLTHLVYSREKNGKTTVYVNGKKVSSRTVSGDIKSWDNSYYFTLANEFTADRPWLGTYHMVAVYSKSFSQEDVEKHFDSGPRAGVDLFEIDPKEKSRKLFSTKVAAIFANKCVECHDSANTKAGLDLTVKSLAMKGGDDGKVIIPGKSTESLLYETIAEDDMPKKKKPLSKEDKAAIKEWIDTGAVWAFDRIDPVLYVHVEKADEKWVRRLTVDEYVNTVRDTLGIDIREDAERLLPADLKADGFSNTAYNLTVDFKHISSYARLAAEIVSKIDSTKFAKRFQDKIESNKKSMESLIDKMGKVVLRGPLDDREKKSFFIIYEEVRDAGGKAEDAVNYILEAMLQSPRFIYRMERNNSKHAAYELASNLSYSIWGGNPDEELFKAADSGALKSKENIEKQVVRMLKNNKAREWSKKFAYEWLNLGHLKNMKPSTKLFPKWDKSLAVDMKNETLAFFDDLVWEQGRPMSHLLNAQFTYLTPELASHYGLKAKSGAGMQKYDLKNIPSRGGILTQGSLLTVGGDEASMVTRGLFVLHDLLRGKVNDPPPEADTTPVPSKHGLTQRGISIERIADRKCGGCHSKFEPLAFGLEKFDGLGSFKEVDHHGNKMRDDGKMNIPFLSKPLSYKNSAEMMDHLANSERVKETITAKLIQFVIGRSLTASDANNINQINNLAQKGNGTYESTMKAILTSEFILKEILP